MRVGWMDVWTEIERKNVERLEGSVEKEYKMTFKRASEGGSETDRQKDRMIQIENVERLGVSEWVRDGWMDGGRKGDR